MSFDLATPVVLFFASSLLLLAYSNRFLVTGNRLGDLCLKAKTASDPVLMRQILNLGERVRLIRVLQSLGVGSLSASLTAILFAMNGESAIGRWAFVLGLVLLLGSLMMALREISLFLDAMDLELGSFPY